MVGSPSTPSRFGQRRFARSLRSLALLVLLSAVPALAQSVEVASVSSTQAVGNDLSEAPSVSDDGLRVAFESHSTNLVAADTNAARDIFLRDRLALVTTRVSVSSSGAQANAGSRSPSLSGGGELVVFSSDASNLVTGDTNSAGDVFARDLVAGTTSRISVASGGSQSNGDSRDAKVSGDGRYVVFSSTASNLVTGDGNGTSDIFLRDRVAGTTTLVSVSSAGVQSNGPSTNPALSRDGRFIAFACGATNLDPLDGDGLDDVYLRDLASGVTTLVSRASDGSKGDHVSSRPALSDDGRVVAFESTAANLVPGDKAGSYDVFLRDVVLGVTTTACVDSAGVSRVGLGDSLRVALSGDGRFAFFRSDNQLLVSDDTNSTTDVFAHDRVGLTTIRMSRASDGSEGDGPCFDPSCSIDGRAVAFRSDAHQLVAGSSSYQQIVLRERSVAPPSWSSYGAGHPGALGVPALDVGQPPMIGRDATFLCGNSSGSWTVGLLLIGSQRAALPTGFGFDLLVDPQFDLLLALPPGGTSFAAELPADDFLVGLTFDLQLLEIDWAASDQISASPGLEVVIGH